MLKLNLLSSTCKSEVDRLQHLVKEFVDPEVHASVCEKLVQAERGVVAAQGAVEREVQQRREMQSMYEQQLIDAHETFKQTKDELTAVSQELREVSVLNSMYEKLMQQTKVEIDEIKQRPGGSLTRIH